MSYSPGANQHSTPGGAVAREVIDQVETLLQSARDAGQPIEIDPHRRRLFELFVMAGATGFLQEGAEHDLTCDGIARELSTRWNLAGSLQPGAMANMGAVPAKELPRLRLLWSFMRMWMEWSYAWERWPEFHEADSV
ncbi:MAG: hypothetical protein ACKV0T_16760 [Planctomycetales bacterium]